MKIQITCDPKNVIDGYMPIMLIDQNFEIDAPENSAELILLNDSIEQIEYSQLDNFLLKISHYLRLGAQIIIRGIDISCLSRDLLFGHTNVEEYNNIVFTKKSIYSINIICDKLRNLGLSIDKAILQGAIYEIYATRPIK